VRDRRVALGVAEADRRGDVEGALAAGESARPRPHLRLLRRDRLCEVPDECVDLYRVTGVRPVSRAFEEHEGRAQLRRESLSALRLDELVFGSVDDERRAADARAELDRRLRVELLGIPAAKANEQGLGIRLEPPADAVLDLLRRVRLREHLRDEELDIAAPVTQPVMTVLLRPALVRVELLV